MTDHGRSDASASSGLRPAGLSQSPLSQAKPLVPNAIELVIVEVREEIARAIAKFPTWPTDPLHAVSVVGEEAGELTKATLQAVYEPHKSAPSDVREEAVQTAAMAIRFVASINRYEFAEGTQHVVR